MVATYQTLFNFGSIESMAFSVDELRSRFPALSRTHNGKQVAYFDNPGGAQVVGDSINAISNYMMQGGSNLHGSFPSSEFTEQTIDSAKQALADFLAVEPKEIALGANMTTLALAIARSLGTMWYNNTRYYHRDIHGNISKNISRSEIVVSEMDHRANVDPWLHIAKELGMTVRWLRVDPKTLTLDLSNIHRVINHNTKLVAIGYASNAVGTINDVKTISQTAKQVGALVAVDAVHAAPHLIIDRDELGADILLCSAYKFFGPHVGIAAIKKELFEQLSAYKLVPAPDHIPEKIETGTHNHEGIAGITPCIDFIASCGDGYGDKRSRIISGMHAIQSHENLIIKRIRDVLSQLDQVSIYAAHPEIDKTPTIAFRINNRDPQAVCRYMADHYGVFLTNGSFYASTLSQKLGIEETGGWIRGGLAPYNTESEAEALINGIKSLC